MGFKPGQRHYELDFTGTALDGLEATVKSMTAAGFLEVQKLQESQDIKPLIDTFSDHLVSWNMDNEDDTPKGTSSEEIITVAFDHLMEIIRAWGNASAGVSVPLDSESTGTDNSLLASIPRETLSESRAS